MKKLLAIAFVIAALAPPVAAQKTTAAGFTGKWVGTFTRPGSQGNPGNVEFNFIQKGNALTEEEFEAIKRHPIIGEEIMAPIDQLSYSLPAIRWHHEKWNGRGYPDGLRREAIPLPARIVSVADSFDAMTTQRVYQQPLSPAEAVAWIRQQSSVSFDARVVEAFMSAYLASEIKPPESIEMRPRPALRPAAVAVGESVYT